ncbi:MAG: beta-glucoside-specific PTS transporter subunit IIABC [bacterium]|nr:beta-glucoside-specific PTS transporter subunit IIABC [bacterium]
MNYNKIAQDILKNVGGEENIKGLTHCFTRLRFVLQDESKADKEVLGRIEGVIGVVAANGELQVVCGAKVNQIFDAIEAIRNKEVKTKDSKVQSSSDTGTKQPAGQRILQIITQIFTPLVPAIAAAGLIKGLLTAAKLIMIRNGLDISTTDTYTILYSASQVIFYFFPIFLAMTTAKALKCNQVIAMVIGGSLCYPAIDALMQDVSVASNIFGIPITKGAWAMGDAVKVFSYTESVIPIILAIIVIAYLERALKRVIPEVVQLILVPGLELIIMLPLTLCLLGPIGIYIGNVIAASYGWLIGVSPVLGGALIGGLWGVFVIFGAHRALLPIGLNDVALHGSQNILAFAGSANFAQGGAALGVMLKTKNKEVKQVAASGTIAATLVGVTEPAIYGCNLRYKKPMVCAIIAGTIGGAIMGFGNVYGDAFANNGVLTIFTYAAFGMKKFMFYLIGIAVAYFGAAILTYVIGFEEDKKQEATEEAEQIEETEEAKEPVTADQEKTTIMRSPMTGEAIPLSEVNDQAFASEALGKGVAVIPSFGEVAAPEDCTVTLIYDTLHAICLTLTNGAEVMIHIGIDTVKLNGAHFTKCVEQGAVVKRGTPIMRFDIEAIKAAGYDVTTPIIVLNTDDYENIESFIGTVDNEKELLDIK